MVSASQDSSRRLSRSAVALLDSPPDSSLTSSKTAHSISFTLKVSHPVSPDDVFNSDFSRAGFSGLDIQQLAAAGYFQAIAYLLNQSLVPQNIYAQVSGSKTPGRLKILVEFERPPQPQRLIRFICDRIYTLDSDSIEGVHIIARTVGSSKTDWEERIRIPTISQRRPISEAASDSSLPPQTSGLQTDSSQANGSSNPKLLHESARSKIARQIVRSQFKFFRAALLSGTATAAFLFGGLTDLVLSERLSTSDAQPKVTLPPWYEDSSSAAKVALDSKPAKPRFTGRTVEAALETVSVISHKAVASPQDPTVTLLFGGELALNDFVFEDAQSLNQLFSELGIYRRADIAMLGISEPLATPSTSLQEHFYHRTRPEAVQALKAGGVDIVSLASEGMLTYGARGLEETLETLDKEGLYRVGAGRDQQEAHRPEILEVKGQRIAYLSYNPETLKAAKENTAGVASASSEERQHMLEDIEAIRSQVDWVVVNYRWGDTLDPLSEPAEGSSAGASAAFGVPAEWQRSLAYDAIDAGADLVVGYHPSQIQGAEIYRDRAIAYSLGDFVFGKTPFEDHDTVALRVSLRNQRMKVEFLPISIRDSRPEMATGDRGSTLLQNIRRASKTFDRPMEFPAILQARFANFRSVPSSSSENSLPALPPEATSSPFSDSFIEPATEEPTLLPDPSRTEAPTPFMHESDALFLIEADNAELETN